MTPRRDYLAALALVVLAGGASLFGCASIVGADFDRPEDDASGGGAGGSEGGTDDGTDGGASGSGGDAGDGGHAAADSGKHDAAAGTDASTVPPGDDDSGAGAGAEAGVDASADSGTHLDGGGDSGHVVDCTGKTTPAKGDFVVTELLIETQNDELDDPGQWLEVTNVSGCPLPVAGLEIYSPNSRTSDADMVTISASDATVLPTGGTFVVANVPAPPDITGKIYSFNATGTLESGDDTVYIYLGAVTISSLDFQWEDCGSNETPCYDKGHSIELPPGCISPESYANNWKASASRYGMTTGGLALYGTPNAPNSDQQACTP